MAVSEHTVEVGAFTNLAQSLVLRSVETEMTQEVMTRDLERDFSRYFFNNYYSLLILPGCHPDFYYGWLGEILAFMLPHESLYYAVIACAASHIQSIKTCVRMQEIALTYYSTAITKLSRILATSSQLQDHDGLLVSIMLLYIHGGEHFHFHSYSNYYSI